ncbi:MAG: nuclear transport factor 2 family protein [Halorubrum sp.]
MTDPQTLAKEYYRRIDDDEYDTLADLLTPSFVHHRPDRTLRGRDRFVAFTRDERPLTDTTHVVENVYDLGPAGSDGAGTDSANTAEQTRTAGTTNVEDAVTSGDVAVQGRLLDADGAELFAFVDVFSLVDGRVGRLETYVSSGGDTT